MSENTTDTTPAITTTVTGLTSRERAALRTSLALMRQQGGMELTDETARFFKRTPEQVEKLLRKRTRQFGISDQHRAGLQDVIDRLQEPTEEKPMSEQINDMAEDLPELIERLAASTQAAQLAAVHEMVNISLVTIDAAIELTKSLRDNNPDDQWIAELFTQLEALSERIDHLETNIKEFVNEPDTDSK